MFNFYYLSILKLYFVGLKYIHVCNQEFKFQIFVIEDQNSGRMGRQNCKDWET